MTASSNSVDGRKSVVVVEPGEQQQVTARAEHPERLAERLGPVGHELEHEGADDQVSGLRPAGVSSRPTLPAIGTRASSARMPAAAARRAAIAQHAQRTGRHP